MQIPKATSCGRSRCVGIQHHSYRIRNVQRSPWTGRQLRCTKDSKTPGGAVVVVGDIGGTNARLSVWQVDGSNRTELFAKTYPTADYATFDEVVGALWSEEVVKSNHPSAAALAVAGAVKGNVCNMTNLSWTVDGDKLSKHFGIRFQVLNDFEAVGYGIPVLAPEDVHQLSGPQPVPKAPKVVMGPGTGLGTAQLVWDEARESYLVLPGEGAHATFAPRGWKQTALAQFVAARSGGLCEVEQVACGPGLQLIYEFLLTDEVANRPALLQNPVSKTPAQITSDALAGVDPLAEEAVDMFLGIVGAEAGQMALRCLALGGVYVAGGITPRLLDRIKSLPEAFHMRQGRAPFQELLANTPLFVVLNGKVGQLGAAEVAASLATKGYFG